MSPTHQDEFTSLLRFVRRSQGPSRRCVVQVQDVMTTKVVTIDAQNSVDQARAKMREAGVHQLVVRAKRGRVVGVIGMADVRAAPPRGAVSDFMSRKLLIVRPGTAV